MSGPVSGWRLRAALFFALIGLSCQRDPAPSPWVLPSGAAPPPTGSSLPTPTQPTRALPTPTPAPRDVAEDKSVASAAGVPVARLRLFVPGSVPARRLDETAPTAQVVVGNLPASTGEVSSFRDSRAGLATLLVITAQADLPKQLIAIDTFVRHAGPADRVALGVIDGTGFRLLRPFTADPSVLPSAARDIAASMLAPSKVETAKGDPSAGTPWTAVALHAGLLDAFTAFRGEEALSAVRRLVLLTAGVDSVVARRSVLGRLVGSITNRAAAYEVPVMAMLFGTSGGAHAAIEQLVRGTGGHVVAVNSVEPTAVEAAVMEMLPSMRELVAIDLLLDALPTLSGTETPTESRDEVPVVVVWEGQRFERKIAVPVAGTGRIDHAMFVPLPVPKTLPLGIADLGRAEADAEVAEVAGNLLRAGAIWHLLAEADPEKAVWAERAAEVDSRYRNEAAWGLDAANPPAGTDGQRAIHLGELVNGAVTITVPLAVKVDLKRITSASKERLAPDLPTDFIARSRIAPPEQDSVGPPGPDPEPTPITQVVLSQCPATSVDECVEAMVVGGQLAHLVLDHDGAVTQLVDLASRIAFGPARRVEAIHIAALSPQDAAWSYAEPGALATGRAFRGQAVGLPTPGGFEDVWDFSPQQIDVLVPLLRGLITANPRIRATFPLDEGKHVVRAPLKEPDSHRGILLSCNLIRTPVGCPGLPQTLDRLHATVRKFRFATAPDLAKPTNLESSLDDLALPGAREGAALRYGIVGELAVPFLLEVGDEAGLSHLHGVVLALHRIARHATPAVTTRILRGLEAFENSLEEREPEPGASAADTVDARRRLRAAIDAVFLEVAGVQDLLLRHELLPRSEESSAFATAEMAILTAAASAISADPTGATPDAARPMVLVEAIERHLSSASPALRSQAAMALVLIDPVSAGAKLEPLLLDADPWVRFIAARAVPADKGFEFLLPLLAKKPEAKGPERRGQPLPVALLARTVGQLVDTASTASAKLAAEALTDAFEYAPLTELAVLESEIVRWGGARSVPKLAQKLSIVVGERKVAVLRTLRTITGRDFGGSPEGWLLWHRQQPRERTAAPPG